MFEPEWIEYFQRESPFAYYCVLFIQLLITILKYACYITILIFLISPIIMLYSGIKGVKIKLSKTKKSKRYQQNKEKIQKEKQNLYINQLHKNIRTKKKKK